MKYIWAVSVVFCSFYMMISGNSERFISLVYEGCEDAVGLILTLCGVMALWGGFMEIAERSGITAVFSQLLSPLIRLIFPEVKDQRAKDAISMNITANLLGLGNAATPLGISAMKRLDTLNGRRETASYSMVTFVILNTASVQLVPMTTAALRAKFGSESPMSILPAVLGASVLSLAVGLIVDRLMRRG